MFKDSCSILSFMSKAGRVPPVVTLALTGLLVAGFGSTGPSQIARADEAASAGAADKLRAMANLKQIGAAMHRYHRVNERFPPAILHGPDGKTPYSWRVALLPLLGQKALHDRYRFDEPWDGPNNRQLLGEMPVVYRCPRDKDDSNNTSYFAITGPRTVFTGDEGCRIRDFRDGTSNTLLVVEAKRSTPWTKPEDLTYDPKGHPPELGGFFPGGFFAVLADGTPKFISSTLNEDTLRALIMKDDGKSVADAFPPARDDEGAAASRQDERPLDATAVRSKTVVGTPSGAKAVVTGDFVVLPLATELQRLGPRRSNAVAYVLINGMELDKENAPAIDGTPVPFDFEELKRALKPYAAGGSKIYFDVRGKSYGRGKPGASQAYSILMRKLEPTAQEVGFREVTMLISQAAWDKPSNWKSLVAALTAPPSGKGGQDEIGVGDDQVKVYPVRTALSRFLYRNADCVVQIVPPLQETKGGLVMRMQRYLPQLDLGKKRRVLFVYNIRSEPSLTATLIEELFTAPVYKTKLGFERNDFMPLN